jgi:hypothetical protein
MNAQIPSMFQTIETQYTPELHTFPFYHILNDLHFAALSYFMLKTEFH